MNEEEHEAGRDDQEDRRDDREDRPDDQEDGRDAQEDGPDEEEEEGGNEGNEQEYRVEPPVALLISFMYLSTTPREGSPLGIYTYLEFMCEIP